MSCLFVSYPSTTPSLGYGIGGAGGKGLPLGTGAASSGVQAQARAGVFVTNVEGPRDFWIAGIEQTTIAPGIVMYPTSEDLSPVIASGNTYVIGSSQFYTVGEVHWNGVKKVQGTDWQLVTPFTHIVQILHPAGISTPITFVYYRWNIGVRAGFKVNSYPVSFAFNGTSIIAERVPKLNEFFVVQFTSPRPGTNQTTLFARYPELVDEVLSSHLLYDGNSGFQTYRPSGYMVWDTADNQLWQWDGATWNSLGTLPANSSFYSKRDRAIFTFNGSTLSRSYLAGDGSSMQFIEVLEYPLYGEGVGKNLLVDAFEPNAQFDHPAAFVISRRPGNYDPWVPI